MFRLSGPKSRNTLQRGKKCKCGSCRLAPTRSIVQRSTSVWFATAIHSVWLEKRQIQIRSFTGVRDRDKRLTSVPPLEWWRHAHRATRAPVCGCKGRHPISLATRWFQLRSFMSVQGHKIDASTQHHHAQPFLPPPFRESLGPFDAHSRSSTLQLEQVNHQGWRVPSRRARNSVGDGCQIVVLFQCSSFEIPLVDAHLSQELPVFKSSIFQGASFRVNVVGPRDK